MPTGFGSSSNQRWRSFCRACQVGSSHCDAEGGTGRRCNRLGREFAQTTRSESPHTNSGEAPRRQTAGTRDPSDARRPAVPACRSQVTVGNLGPGTCAEEMLTTVAGTRDKYRAISRLATRAITPSPRPTRRQPARRMLPTRFDPQVPPRPLLHNARCRESSVARNLWPCHQQRASTGWAHWRLFVKDCVHHGARRTQEESSVVRFFALTAPRFMPPIISCGGQRHAKYLTFYTPLH